MIDDEQVASVPVSDQEQARTAGFVFLLALVLGYLMKRTRSLWACVVCCAMSNRGATL